MKCNIKGEWKMLWLMLYQREGGHVEHGAVEAVSEILPTWIDELKANYIGDA
jgi:hypothetical protein